MKKFIIISLIVILIIVSIFLLKNDYKILKKGNNINIKSAEKIKEYILNISSYEAKAEITITSNKTKNIYEVIQSYSKENNSFTQEILKPENLRWSMFCI